MQLYKCFRDLFLECGDFMRWLRIDAGAPWIRDALAQACYQWALVYIPPRKAGYRLKCDKGTVAQVLRNATNVPCMSLIRAYGYLASHEDNSQRYRCRTWVHDHLVRLPPASALVVALMRLAVYMEVKSLPDYDYFAPLDSVLCLIVDHQSLGLAEQLVKLKCSGNLWHVSVLTVPGTNPAADVLRQWVGPITMYMTLQLIEGWRRYDRRDVHHYVNALEVADVISEWKWGDKQKITSFIQRVALHPSDVSIDVALMNMPLIAWHFNLLKQQQQVALLCDARRAAVAQALLSHLPDFAARAVSADARAILMRDQAAHQHISTCMRRFWRLPERHPQQDSD